MHKLLFDNNISHRVLPRIADIFSDTTHVMLANLDESSDEKVWYFAQTNDYAVKIFLNESDSAILEI